MIHGSTPFRFIILRRFVRLKKKAEKAFFSSPLSRKRSHYLHSALFRSSLPVGQKKPSAPARLSTRFVQSFGAVPTSSDCFVPQQSSGVPQLVNTPPPGGVAVARLHSIRVGTSCLGPAPHSFRVALCGFGAVKAPPAPPPATPYGFSGGAALGFFY